MSSWNLIQLQTAQELRSEAQRWDDLWLHSASTLPTLRADVTALWVEHFANDRDFVGLVVEHENRFVAALPLVRSKTKGVIPTLGLTSNPWATCGELLLDLSCDSTTAMRALVDGLRTQPAALLILDGVELDCPRWRSFQTALDTAALRSLKNVDYVAGRAATYGSWEMYQGCWSKSHRRNLNRTQRRLEKLGPIEARFLGDIRPDEVDDLLLQVFDVEHRSWKGANGTSVLATPGMLDFYQRQARLLASRGELQLSLLEANAWPIASEMGYFARGVSYAHKIGYDETYAQYGPGQLLKQAQFQHYFAKEGQQLVDFMGALSGASARWSTHSYQVGRLVTSTGGLCGDSLFHGFRSARHLWRFLRHRSTDNATPSAPQLGAAKMLDASETLGSQPRTPGLPVGEDTVVEHVESNVGANAQTSAP